MNHEVIKVFIGFDPVESVAWHTMAHSILDKCSRPVALIPVNIKNLGSIYKRLKDPKQSNEFSFTRFLVPYLCAYEGYAIFFDCDMMLRNDLSSIFDVIDNQPDRAVYVVKHDYEPRDDVKYLNTVQYKYPRKNWSSVVLWNCGHSANQKVTPEFVNTASAMDLHRFNWLQDSEIGELDVRWNWLVGEYDQPPQDVKNVHWTVGGPYFDEYKNADFAGEWFAEHQKMNYCMQRPKAGILK
jgi:lipopolysaccharide biosynthesis glycosyltransferase